METHGPRVNSQTIILILHLGPRNRDTGTISDVERIGIMAQRARITSRIIDRDVIESQTLRAVDAEDLDRRVEDRYAGDGDEGAGPFGVAKGCAALEDDLEYIISDLLSARRSDGSLHECLWIGLSNRGSCLQVRRCHSV